MEDQSDMAVVAGGGGGERNQRQGLREKTDQYGVNSTQDSIG